MKKLLLTSIVLFFVGNTFGQKTEWRIALNSGLFSFSGKSAQNTTFINFSDKNNTGYTNNPYGAKNGICDGLSVNFRRVSKINLLVGFDLGYETLRSKILIDGISGYTGTSTYGYEATGKTFLNYDFVNLYPYIGYRINSKNVSFDLLGGFEIAYCVGTNESGNATAANGTKYVTNLDRKTISTDVRPSVQLSVNYHKTGVYVGYAYGFANYKAGYVGGINECFTRLVRFGVTYRIK